MNELKESKTPLESKEKMTSFKSNSHIHSIIDSKPNASPKVTSATNLIICEDPDQCDIRVSSEKVDAYHMNVIKRVSKEENRITIETL